MKLILPAKVKGKVRAPPSKSMAQRAIAIAALAKGTSTIRNMPDCDDALAALSCARALGVKVSERNGTAKITGIAGKNEIAGKMPNSKAAGRTGKASRVLNCHESGLSLRMFTPIACAFPGKALITGKGSLLKRPVGMIEKPLTELGAKCITRKGFAPINVQGPLQGGNAVVDGSTSSQFVTGLLIALPICAKDSTLAVKDLKSKPYVEMTIQLIGKFGVKVKADKNLSKFKILGNQEYKPIKYDVEGDWSGASFLLVAGAISGRIEVSGLDTKSLQADMAIVDALRKTGAIVRIGKSSIIVQKPKNGLRAFEFDATQCPDLFPPLAALATNCSGTTRIRGAMRLAGKESDRGAAISEELGKLGGKVKIIGDVMEIIGTQLEGGNANSHNDHRIAMMCAVAALNSKKGVRINGEECVAKSYPNFFEDLKKICMKSETHGIGGMKR